MHLFFAYGLVERDFPGKNLLPRVIGQVVFGVVVDTLAKTSDTTVTVLDVLSRVNFRGVDVQLSQFFQSSFLSFRFALDVKFSVFGEPERDHVFLAEVRRSLSVPHATRLERERIEIVVGEFELTRFGQRQTCAFDDRTVERYFFMI